MKVVGISMMRDEVDIAALTIRWMQAQEFDAIVVADNLSTDGTGDILRSLGVDVLIDDVVAYRQSEKMTGLAHYAARTYNAHWVVPFDADELWWSPYGTVGSILRASGAKIVRAELWNYVATGYDNPNETDPVKRLSWRSPTPLPLPKVACRWTRKLIISMGNHGALYEGREPMTVEDGLRIRHYPYRSAEQVVRKIRNGAAAYKAAVGMPEMYGEHWRKWGEFLDREGPSAIENLFRKWYYREKPDEPIEIDGETHPALVFDPVR